MISGLNYKLVCGFGSELHDTQWPQQNRSDSEISESDFDFCIMKMKMQVLLGSKKTSKFTFLVWCSTAGGSRWSVWPVRFSGPGLSGGPDGSDGSDGSVRELFSRHVAAKYH